MKKYLIIGSSSYIAKNLIQKLLETNSSIFITLITRNKISLKDKRVSMINGSIANYKKILKYTDRKTYIFLFSNLVDPSSYSLNNFKNFIKNITFYYNLLSNLNNKNCKKIYFISSAGSLLSDIPKKKFNEFSANPYNLYGLSKFNIEKIINFLSINNKFRYTIFRLYNIYGKTIHQYSQIYGIVNKSINNCFLNKSTLITVDPKKTLINFTFIDDAINFILKNLDSKKKNILCKKSDNISLQNLISYLKKISNNKILFKIESNKANFKTMLNHNSKNNIEKNIKKIYLSYQKKFDD